MRLRVFASGSGGNCLAVSSGSTSLLIDLGLSCRTLLSRMKQCSFSPEKLSGVVFTHDHTDHCSAAAVFRKKFPEVPFFANDATADAISSRYGIEDGWVVFEQSSPFEVGCLEVAPFSVPHDAADATGYLVSDGEKTLFVATDLGFATKTVLTAFSRADCAVLEANHDPSLLVRSGRPWPLIQRISGRSGHLSNDDTAAIVHDAASPSLSILLLAHLSTQCNSPHLALEAVRQALSQRKECSPAIETLSQDVPSRLYTF